MTASTTGRVRWSGVRLHAGCVLLVPGMTEEHFDRLAAVGTRLAKFIFYPFGEDRSEAKRYVEWCHERGMRVKIHTGGVSRSGANRSCGYDILSWLQPDIAAHVSGGPIPMPDGDIDAASTTPHSRSRSARPAISARRCARSADWRSKGASIGSRSAPIPRAGPA